MKLKRPDAEQSKHLLVKLPHCERYCPLSFTEVAIVPGVRRILFFCVTVGEELLVGVVIGAVGVRVRVRVRMIDLSLIHI